MTLQLRLAFPAHAEDAPAPVLHSARWCSDDASPASSNSESTPIFPKFLSRYVIKLPATGEGCVSADCGGGPQTPGGAANGSLHPGPLLHVSASQRVGDDLFIFSESAKVQGACRCVLFLHV